MIKLRLELLVVQLWLLCTIAKAHTFVNPFSLEVRGGYFNNHDVYIMNVNETMELTITIKGYPEVIVKYHWKKTEGFTNLPPLNVLKTRIHPSGNEPEITKWTVRVIAIYKSPTIAWELINDRYGLSSHYHKFAYYVQSPIPPTVGLLGGIEKFNTENGVHRIAEHERFSLNCYGGGLESYMLSWVDSTGHPVVDTETTELLQITTLAKNEVINVKQQILNVTARKGMKGFGCKMTAPLYGSRTYNAIDWFHFAVGYGYNAIITIDNQICGQLTFTCSTNDFKSEKVDIKTM